MSENRALRDIGGDRNSARIDAIGDLLLLPII